jgi:hypothetical protein
MNAPTVTGIYCTGISKEFENAYVKMQIAIAAYPPFEQCPA